MEWLDLNDDLIETGAIFNRSKLPADRIVLLKLTTENNQIKFILKLKPTKLFVVTNYSTNSKSPRPELSESARKTYFIQIQTVSNPGVKLKCISGRLFVFT